MRKRLKTQDEFVVAGYSLARTDAPDELMSHRYPDDHALVRALIDARPQAWERLVQRIADTVWSACRVLTADEAEARAAFAEVMEAMRADGFRRLRPYNGSSRIETFTALVARDVLTDRLLHLFQFDDGAKAWVAFERLFLIDIERIIGRRLPGADRDEIRSETYQDVCVALIADDFRRIRAYRGHGSFGGFVLHTVDRLVIDSIRRMVPGSREGTTAPVMMALEDHGEIPCADATPEEALLTGEDERLLHLAAEVLREATAALKDHERLYLRIALGSGEPIPAREVARQMRRPVEEIYKLKQRVMTQLREALDKNPAVKMWRASV